MDGYVGDIDKKIRNYILDLKDAQLLDHPPDYEYDRFTLLLAQFRHLHSHMGMIMGFIIDDTGLWPRVLGLEHPIPEGEYSQYVS